MFLGTARKMVKIDTPTLALQQQPATTQRSRSNSTILDRRDNKCSLQ